MFTFVSGNLALDFAGTVQERNAGFIDLLTAPAALDEWLIAAGLLDSAAQCDAAALARAVELREAVYRLALATSVGEPWRDADRVLVNRIADGPKPSIALRADTGVTRRGDCDHALARIATEAIELRRTRSRSDQTMRPRHLHTPLPRHLPRGFATLVRYDAVRQPRQERVVPRSPRQAVSHRAGTSSRATGDTIGRYPRGRARTNAKKKNTSSIARPHTPNCTSFS